MYRDRQRLAVLAELPHDLRRTCARLCHTAGGELEQIQFLLGHVSIHTTERYLGCNCRGLNQDLRELWPTMKKFD